MDHRIGNSKLSVAIYLIKVIDRIKGGKDTSTPTGEPVVSHYTIHYVIIIVSTQSPIANKLIVMNIR